MKKMLLVAGLVIAGGVVAAVKSEKVRDGFYQVAEGIVDGIEETRQKFSAEKTV